MLTIIQSDVYSVYKRYFMNILGMVLYQEFINLIQDFVVSI